MGFSGWVGGVGGGIILFVSFKLIFRLINVIKFYYKKARVQMYYNTSKNNHGLPYNSFKALTVPRPIGWISTVSKNGLSYDPAFVMFSAGNRADGSKKGSVLNT